MFFNIVGDIIGFVRPYGLRLRRSGVGGSVARANEANVSMTKFTQSICTALSGTDFFYEKKISHPEGETLFARKKIVGPWKVFLSSAGEINFISFSAEEEESTTKQDFVECFAQFVCIHMWP